MPLVADVGHLVRPRDPADLRLGEEDLQAREALEHPVERHLYRVEKPEATEPRDLRGEIGQRTESPGAIVERLRDSAAAARRAGRRD